MTAGTMAPSNGGDALVDALHVLLRNGGWGDEVPRLDVVLLLVRLINRGAIGVGDVASRALRLHLLVLFALGHALDALHRRGNLARGHDVPVDAGEVLVLLDLLRALGAAAETLLPVLCQQPLAAGAAFFGRETSAAVNRILSIPGRVRQRAVREFVEKDTDGIPVGALAVGLAAAAGPAHFGGHVAVGADARGALRLLLRNARGQTHVDEAHVSLVVDEQVLGLEVAVEDALCVDVAHHLNDLHHGPAHLLRREASLGEHKLGEVAVGHDVHHEDEKLRVLEGVLQVDEKGVLQHRHDLLLRRDLLPPRRPEVLLHHLLLHHLHGVVDAAVALDHVDDLAEAALAQHADHFKVVERWHYVLLALELENVPVVRRSEEILEARLVQMLQHARLRCLEDLAR
mmetsp:Transcript_23006/g.44745  ORF Transcript_23006/g.44745 Transcript_23006/m.44745 type:complete len:401 (-) Transcript_23006:1904-3106(-)